MKVRTIETDEEIKQVAEWSAKVFCGGDHLFFFQKRFERSHEPGPHYVREHTRVVEEDGRVVAHVRIVDHPMRIGSAVVRMGGISGVCTHPAYRKRGYAAALMRDSMEYMRTHGFDVSMLFGIRDFYPKFGYSVCLNRFSIKMAAKGTAGCEGKGCVRKIKPEELSQAASMYAEHNAHRTCSVVRSGEFWQHDRKGAVWSWPYVNFDEWYAVCDEADRMLGYFCAKEERGRVELYEAAGGNDEVFSTILQYLGVRAKASFMGEISLILPPDAPMAQFCFEKDAKLEAFYREDGDGMMRIIHLEGLFGKLKEELEARLRHSEFKDWEGAFTLRTDIGALDFEVARGVLDVKPGDQGRTLSVEMPQSLLIKLVVGYADPLRLLSKSDVEVARELVGPLCALFPRGTPFIWGNDGF